MLKANTTILIGKKKIEAGQAVEGLSCLDEKWMKDAGYIEETAQPDTEKKAAESRKGRAKKEDPEDGI